MKRLALAMLAAALAAATTSHAQTTNCSWIGQIWTCNQSPRQTQLDPSIITQIGNLNDPARLAAQQQAQLNALRARQEAHDRAVTDSYERAQRELADERARLAQALRENVGKSIAAGDCKGAQNTALQAGDIDLANQVQSYCARLGGK